MRSVFAVVAVAATLGVAAVAGSVAAPTYVIQGDRVVGGLAVARATAADARARVSGRRPRRARAASRAP